MLKGLHYKLKVPAKWQNAMLKDLHYKIKVPAKWQNAMLKGLHYKLKVPAKRQNATAKSCRYLKMCVCPLFSRSLVNIWRQHTRVRRRKWLIISLLSVVYRHGTMHLLMFLTWSVRVCRGTRDQKEIFAKNSRSVFTVLFLKHGPDGAQQSKARQWRMFS